MRGQDFHIQWHITDRCNLRCRHCYQDSFQGKGELDWPALKKISDDLIETMKRKDQKLTISLTGGEPLLKKELWPLLDHLSQSDQVSELNIITNATLIEENIDKLKKPSKLKTIDVSLDGLNPETNDAIRGKGTFDKVGRGLKTLKANGFEVIIMFTLLKSNIQEALKLFEFSEKNSLEGFILERFIPLGQSRKIKDELVSASQLQALFIQVFKRCGLEYFQESAKYHALKVETSDQPCLYGAECVVGRFGCAVLSDGTVLPCRRFYLPLGNLLDRSLYDIWESSDVLRRISQRENLHGKCKDCKIDGCLGCRALSHALSGDYLGPDELCWLDPLLTKP